MATAEVDNSLLHQHIRIRMSHDIISTVTAVQGDTAREFYFIFDDYDIPEDAEVRVYVQKPSGKEIYHYCYLANGEVVVQPTMQMLAEEGQNLGQIQIIRNHAIVTSYIFRLTIEKNIIYSINTTSMDEFLILSDLIDNARIAIGDIRVLENTVESQESDRVSAEESRVQAEANREANTAIAISNCNDAVDNVNVLSESVSTAEGLRVQAEADRTQAEIERQNNTATAISNCNDAADRATAIADSIEETIAGVVNDDIVSLTTTYSSEKIESELNVLEALMSTIIQINASEPSNQIIGGLWFAEEE